MSSLTFSNLICRPRDDDYFFGVLQSVVHESWTLATCSWMGVGNDPSYNSSITFGTFPFPWPPGHEPKNSPQVEAIAGGARGLVVKRDAWLNPPNASAEELKKRTLTNLYNTSPAWLADARRKLDKAVFAAYGWPIDLGGHEILGRLLELNRERAAGHSPMRGSDLPPKKLPRIERLPKQRPAVRMITSR